MKEIAVQVKCSVSAVEYTLARFKKTGSNETVPGRGRKQSLTMKDKRYLVLNSVRDRRKTVTELSAEFNLGREKPVSRTVIRNYLRVGGMNGRVAAKKPLLRKANMRKRLAFAKAHVHWTLEQWYRVLWTDETKIEFFGSKRRTFVRRRKGERFRSFCLVPTMKHGGGSLMVWAAISAHGAAPLKRIQGIMDQHSYHSILVRQAVPAGKKLIGHGFILQQDNDPKHTSKKCVKYITSKEKEGTFQKLFY